MKYIAATIAILGAILIYQNNQKKIGWDHLKDFGDSMVESYKSSECLNQARELENKVKEINLKSEENPNRLTVSLTKWDLKEFIKFQEDNNCNKLVKTFLTRNGKEEFLEKSVFLQDQFDLYAVASGEPYLLVKLKRLFGIH